MTLTPRTTAISLLVSLVCASGGFAQAASAEKAPTQATGQNWQDLTNAHARSLAGSDSVIIGGKSVSRGIKASKFRSINLDKRAMLRLVAGAPNERSVKKGDSGFIISLPHPEGGYQRFRLVESPIMEAELAARHPEIKTFAGRGVDDPNASLRMDVSPLGLHASVRSAKGNWYVDPMNATNDSVHATYFTRDAVNQGNALREGSIDAPQLLLDRSFYHAADSVEVRGAGFEPNGSVSITVRGETESAPTQNFVTSADAEGVINFSFPADPTGNIGAYVLAARDASNETTSSFSVVADSVTTSGVTGITLRTYRLALLTDPSYATYFGAANVTAAKVSLVNRVNQIYEDETSIRLVLIGNNDVLNLNTTAAMNNPGGPCGDTACFTVSQSSSCVSGTLSRNRVVLGLLVGASAYDIGHIALGNDGGGIASLGVVGTSAKAQGCTGVPTPDGDYFAVDYVAHEMGHQFAGNHTFNGAVGSCTGGNRNAGTSVEPGSGSSIMAYAGICGTDNLQPHSDPYWSQRSFDEITAYTAGAESTLSEIQQAALTGYTGAAGQSFKIAYNGNVSATTITGTPTAAVIKAAIESTPGWPSGATVTASAVSLSGFTVTFGGALAGADARPLSIVNAVGASGYVGEITKGGSTTRRGATSDTGNSAPVVTVTAGYTIPVRTPFVLTGSATDVDANTVTYMWEQNDRGGAGGTGLISNSKVNGPLFRQFGTRAIVSYTDSLQYNSPGENIVTTNPTRVFPDMVQILANNTNALTGQCPLAGAAAPTTTEVDCFSEWLPTAAYVGVAGVNASPATLHFRLTARDGKGGIGSGTTTLTLAPAAGPFLVTSPNTAVSYNTGSTQTVTWNVANTNVAPVSTANVKISLSTDGGTSFATVLAASVPNTGSASVVMPASATTTARLKIEAVDNIYFDVSDTNFTLVTPPPPVIVPADVDGDGVVSCIDLAAVKAAIGKRSGQAGYSANLDVNKDGVINILDVNLVTKALASGTTCVK
ncbi:M12 family metallo-peptidase [Massilia sp. DWR3-1-1]|uniref:M12 family metallo-peptidase n=1 Tax=Massilia sp. DWR3-1-1 TaxID=2804559 RepID=UPI003CE9D8EC